MIVLELLEYGSKRSCELENTFRINAHYSHGSSYTAQINLPSNCINWYSVYLDLEIFSGFVECDVCGYRDNPTGGSV